MNQPSSVREGPQPVSGVLTADIHRVVKAAAARAGLPAEVSAHWLRHAHASHSLDRGAPIHLLQATLGYASVATTGRYLHARPSESSARFLGGVSWHVGSLARSYGASKIRPCRSRADHGSVRPPGSGESRRLHPAGERLQGAQRERVPVGGTGRCRR
ncbi:tyrosine-type recombinase/integrase [Methylobacterium sp. NEAU K]|uniref:tyrosine-type recombinase/integrase n=1 Tax=Methylobacterium sp. NEAU K TaxID=3064946 RepID=UPI002734490A|nr:tyrosine-type recombinase/integrase [Methylobacterium sp. NEAU K]MDP4005636.1 tyrosine-type recombinase/integrase [Methylobacterium sp. NEAU K]